MRRATFGSFLINEALPEDLRDYNRVLDKKALTDLLREVAQKHPESYRDVSHKLLMIGKDGSQQSGGWSFSLEHLRKSKAAQKIQERISSKLVSILGDNRLTAKQREEQIVRAIGTEMKTQQDEVFNEALQQKNPLAMQILSGARGNRMNLTSLLGSDLLYADHHDRPIPVPILHSYSQGLKPSEYWAATYGARRGVLATKFAVQEAGYLAKQLNQLAHRLVVVDRDDEEEDTSIRGLPMDLDDPDNEGALLAADAGPYKRNTVLTPQIIRELQRSGLKRVLLRSPITSRSPDGVYARDVGVRETGRLPGRGTQVGLAAAQAISEPLSQGTLSAKHSGGVSGEEKALSGFQRINQLIQSPKVIKVVLLMPVLTVLCSELSLLLPVGTM